MRSLAVLLVVLLAGCSGSAPTEGTSNTALASGQAATGAPVVEGLNWSVGQTWTHDIVIGNGTNAIAFTNQVVVTEQTDIGWLLRTTDADVAINNAAFFFQDLGEMLRRGELVDNGYSFPYYSFPLSDKKTWTAQESNIGPDLQPLERTLTMTASWMAPAGTVPGHYMIEAREGDAVRARYDYRPDLQWFSFYEGDVDGSSYRMETTASGKNWKGEHHHSSGELLFGVLMICVTPAPADLPQVAQCPPGAVASRAVTMGADATHALILQFAFGAPGGGATQVLAPDGTRYSSYGAYALDPNPVAADGAQSQVIVPAQAGTWQMQATMGGAFAAGYGLFLWQSTLTTDRL